MLTDKQMQDALKVFERRMQAATDLYYRKMGEHIRNIGQLVPSDVHRLQQLRRMDRNLSEVKRRLAQAAGMNVRDIEKVLAMAAETDDRVTKKILGVTDVSVSLKNNVPLQRALRAQIAESAGGLNNLSKTTVATEAYRKAVDAAVTAVQSGAEDYESAIRRTLKQAGAMGLRVRDEGTSAVEYASGHTRRVDTAVRMNVLDAMRRMNQRAMEEVGRSFGANGVEIDAHMLCAEDHLPYQGQQFSNEEFEEIQDSLPRPFGEWNCRHSWHGIILGVSPPAYTPEQLSMFERYSTEPVTIDGMTKTRYEWSQELRRMETAVRQQKDTANLARATGDDKLRLRCQGTILQLNQKYEALANKAGLQPEFQRTYVAGFKDVKPDKNDGNRAVAASRSYVNKDDRLFECLKLVKPIQGYEDFGAHGKPYYLEIDTNNGQTERYNAKQFADILRSDPEYHGGDIRLLVCNSGEKDDGFAQQLSKNLNVNVLAPDEALWISDGEDSRKAGEMFITNIETLAYLWYNGIDVKATGHWRRYKPDGTWELFE